MVQPEAIIDSLGRHNVIDDAISPEYGRVVFYRHGFNCKELREWWEYARRNLPMSALRRYEVMIRHCREIHPHSPLKK